MTALFERVKFRSLWLVTRCEDEPVRGGAVHAIVTSEWVISFSFCSLDRKLGSPKWWPGCWGEEKFLHPPGIESCSSIYHSLCSSSNENKSRSFVEIKKNHINLIWVLGIWNLWRTYAVSKPSTVRRLIVYCVTGCLCGIDANRKGRIYFYVLYELQFELLIPNLWYLLKINADPVLEEPVGTKTLFFSPSPWKHDIMVTVCCKYRCGHTAS
jgi:hypothetical protein